MADVIALPTAAAEPPPRKRWRGRYPKGVTPISKQRYKRQDRVTGETPIPQKLRCQEGDIVAFVNTSGLRNYGKLGRVARRLSPQEEALYPSDVLHWRVEALGCRFEVTDDEKTWFAGHALAADWELCPLRVELGAEELLRILGKELSDVR